MNSTNHTGIDPKAEIGKTKTPLHLVPTITMEEAAKAHAIGAEQYGPWNWRETKIDASTYIGALMRHVNAFRDGEDACPKSGVSHLGHIIANCGILLDAAQQGTLVDDRPRPALKPDPLANMGGDFTSVFAKTVKTHRIVEPDKIIPPAKTYRALECGEIIKAGDEWRFGNVEEWNPVSDTIGELYDPKPAAAHTYHAEHRRPVEMSSPFEGPVVGFPPAKNPPLNYDSIILTSLQMKDQMVMLGENLDRYVWVMGREIADAILNHCLKIMNMPAVPEGWQKPDSWQGIPVRIVEGRSLTLKPIDE